MWKKIPVQCSRPLPTEGRTRGNALPHQREERTKPPYIPSSHFLPPLSASPDAGQTDTFLSVPKRPAPKRTPIPCKTLRSVLLSLSRNRAPSPPPRSSRIRFGTSPRTKPLCYGPLLRQLPFHSIHESHVHTWKTLRQTSSSLRGKPFGHTAAQTFGRPPKMRPHVHPKTYPPSLPFIISIAGGSVRLLRSCDIDNSSSVSLPFAVEQSPLRM